jgi:hypothetical protein
VHPGKIVFNTLSHLGPPPQACRERRDDLMAQLEELNSRHAAAASSASAGRKPAVRVTARGRSAARGGKASSMPRAT